MAWFTLTPEVPADNADKTWDNTTDPPTLVSVVFSFVASVGTELFSSGLGGIHGVTEPLAEALAETDFTGYRLVPATGERSIYYQDRAEVFGEDVGPDPLTIPTTLFALEVNGRAGVDDFAQTRRLVLSERATDFLCARDPGLSTLRGEVDETGRMMGSISDIFKGTGPQ
ncbi:MULTISPECIES: hypothetical protein [unclassified Nocardia]|uniref:hypothetical protein n=1 Tax=unclassified Nocardia TaxID=2637762 RepID=UPI00278C0F8E|nr:MULTISPECIES: hypothetical protein [unclassified Nocardia]